MRGVEPIRKFLAALAETLALDSIYKLEHRIDPNEDPELKDLRTHKDLLSEKQLEELLSELSRFHSEEEKRQDTLESKATTLLGFISLASGIVAGVSQVSLNVDVYTQEFRIIIFLINVLIGISLLISITLALQATRVGKYKFMSPSLSSFWGYMQSERQKTLRSRALTTLYSHIHNREVINRKAAYVSGAQLWFRNAIILFFVLSTALGVPLILNVNQSNVTVAVTPMQVVVFTPTIPPTLTLFPTDTPSITATLPFTPTP